MPTTFVNPLAGANSARRVAQREFVPGTVALDNQNRNWVYVGPAATAVAAGAVCTVTGAFAVNNTAGNHTNETDAVAAFAIGDYGWVRRTASAL